MLISLQGIHFPQLWHRFWPLAGGVTIDLHPQMCGLGLLEFIWSRGFNYNWEMTDN